MTHVLAQHVFSTFPNSMQGAAMNFIAQLLHANVRNIDMPQYVDRSPRRLNQRKTAQTRRFGKPLKLDTAEDRSSDIDAPSAKLVQS